MEMQVVDSAERKRRAQVDHERQMYLVKARLEHEIIVLIYRVAAMLIGVVLMVIGYLLINTMLVDGAGVNTHDSHLSGILPAAVFGIAGLVFCILGVAKIMPLPDFDFPELNHPNSRRQFRDDGIPVLAPLAIPALQDKLWSNNVKPLMKKVAHNERISSSDRELLRNWLETL